LIDHVVVSSAAITPILTREGLVPAQRVTVFPPTTNLAPFIEAAARPRENKLRAELGVAPGETLTLSVGRLAVGKGHEILIRAWGRTWAGWRTWCSTAKRDSW